MHRAEVPFGSHTDGKRRSRGSNPRCWGSTPNSGRVWGTSAGVLPHLPLPRNYATLAQLSGQGLRGSNQGLPGGEGLIPLPSISFRAWGRRSFLGQFPQTVPGQDPSEKCQSVLTFLSGASTQPRNRKQGPGAGGWAQTPEPGPGI